MPRIPDSDTLNAKNIQLDPVKVLTAVINDMNDPELEQKLVDAGVATYVEEEG